MKLFGYAPEASQSNPGDLRKKRFDHYRTAYAAQVQEIETIREMEKDFYSSLIDTRVTELLKYLKKQELTISMDQGKLVIARGKYQMLTTLYSLLNAEEEGRILYYRINQDEPDRFLVTPIYDLIPQGVLSTSAQNVLSIGFIPRVISCNN